MNRLDEEMQLSSFLFSDMDVDRRPANTTNTVQDEKEPEASHDKESGDYVYGYSNKLGNNKNYILRRAQLLVYKYSKEKNMLRLTMYLVIFLLAMCLTVIMFMFKNLDINTLDEITVPNVVIFVVFIILVVVFLYLRKRYIQFKDMVEDIYSMIVQFQINAGEYKNIEADESIIKFTEDLEGYIHMKRGKNKTLEKGGI